MRRVPAALRNKPQSAFKEHQESMWLTVGREQLKLWAGKNSRHMCTAGNLIRFKVVELDEEKFVPVKSEWITSEVR